MKMIFDFKDAHSEEVDGVIPSFTQAEHINQFMTVCGVDPDGLVVTAQVPLVIVKRIIWEND